MKFQLFAALLVAGSFAAVNAEAPTAEAPKAVIEPETKAVKTEETAKAVTPAAPKTAEQK